MSVSVSVYVSVSVLSMSVSVSTFVHVCVRVFVHMYGVPRFAGLIEFRVKSLSERFIFIGLLLLTESYFIAYFNSAFSGKSPVPTGLVLEKSPVYIELFSKRNPTLDRGC